LESILYSLATCVITLDLKHYMDEEFFKNDNFFY